MNETDCRDDRFGGDETQQQTNKRLTLNLLIQGAAMHSFLTAHHVVKDELEELHSGLTRLYDKFAASASLYYFIGDIVVLYGLPSRFWSRVNRRNHPFYRHRLLVTHGGLLLKESKRYFAERARTKSVSRVPLIHLTQFYKLFSQIMWIEQGKKARLNEIAERAHSIIWKIDQSRLEASITTEVAFGHLRRPKTFVGRITRKGAAGYGGVERRHGQFMVVAKSFNWPLVSHELAKGTVELICLHGLSNLDDSTYELVTAEADQIEYETWMLQSGSELWRRFLAVNRNDYHLPEVIMHVARLDPQPLEEFMMAVIEDRTKATRLLQRIMSG